MVGGYSLPNLGGCGGLEVQPTRRRSAGDGKVVLISVGRSPGVATHTLTQVNRSIRQAINNWNPLVNIPGGHPPPQLLRH
jgi:hypothetical protein